MHMSTRMHNPMCFALFCSVSPSVLFCLASPCLALPCLTLPCLALPYLALPCLALPRLALPCLALPCLALSCHAVCVNLFHPSDRRMNSNALKRPTIANKDQRERERVCVRSNFGVFTCIEHQGGETSPSSIQWTARKRARVFGLIGRGESTNGTPRKCSRLKTGMPDVAAATDAERDTPDVAAPQNAALKAIADSDAEKQKT